MCVYNDEVDSTISSKGFSFKSCEIYIGINFIKSSLKVESIFVQNILGGDDIYLILFFPP